ncbi:Chemotaxis response regulator protein-glutamate methylesterase [Thalassocella blandensis]|nr:Chemotaxis response regulator protein-glutamate methylesterase [Thalassocella blandensis]
MSRSGRKVKVIVVDDSALIRALLKEILESSERIEVVAAACDAYEARELIKLHNPDVLTLDIEMPKMNGITFLKNLMRLRPMPVVMISTLTQEGAPTTLEALEIGAIDFIGKPKHDGGNSLDEYRDIIVEKVLAASRASIRPQVDSERESRATRAKTNLGSIANKKLRSQFICAIGASTGGTEAIKEVVSGLPPNCPPLVIAQHIPASFSASFARRLDGLSAAKVYEAEHDQHIEAGCVYVAPGHSHLRIAKAGGRYVCKLDQGEFINRHRPAVEALFDSVREVAGKHAMGVILTGMGADGSAALLRMRQAGCLTIAQDEASSIVWGMPGMAVKMEGAVKVLDLHDIAKSILHEAFH